MLEVDTKRPGNVVTIRMSITHLNQSIGVSELAEALREQPEEARALQEQMGWCQKDAVIVHAWQRVIELEQQARDFDNLYRRKWDEAHRTSDERLAALRESLTGPGKNWLSEAGWADCIDAVKQQAKRIAELEQRLESKDCTCGSWTALKDARCQIRNLSADLRRCEREAGFYNEGLIVATYTEEGRKCFEAIQKLQHDAAALGGVNATAHRLLEERDQAEARCRRAIEAQRSAVDTAADAIRQAEQLAEELAARKAGT